MGLPKLQRVNASLIIFIKHVQYIALRNFVGIAVCVAQWFDERLRPEGNPILPCITNEKSVIICRQATDSSLDVFLIL
jgi:hypothetical protein